MKRFSSILIASSLFWLAVTGCAEPRPHYGGTLRISVKEAPQALDPATMEASDSGNIARLVFETLTHLDDQGRPQPLLASTWQSEPGNQRWRISLRPGVSFHDGFPLDAASVVASLRASNPEWNVVAIGEMVMIETSSPDLFLPAELALERNAIVRHTGDALSGTGLFSIGDWSPGRHLTLVANEQYWDGPPFVDSVEVSFGISERDQLLGLDLGKAEIVEIAPEAIRRARAEGRSVSSSEPVELLALKFNADASSDDETHLRNALAASLDRVSLGDVVLQGGAAPATGLLPNCLSGYEFALPSGNMDLGRREKAQVRHVPNWTLSYDASDAIARVVAERILLNARDAGINIQLATTDSADMKLVRVALVSSDPHLALSELAKSLQLAPPQFSSGSIEELYGAEKTLLASRRVIPLLHLRKAISSSARVHDVRIASDARWQLGDTWLSPEKP